MKEIFSIVAAATLMLVLGACNEENIVVQEQTSKTFENWPPISENASVLADDYFQENLVLILDMSGSMSEATCNDTSISKDLASKKAIDEFINFVPDDMAIGFVVFENGISTVRTPLGLQNQNNIRQVLNRVGPDGGTPLGGAVHEAYQMLLSQAQAQRGYGNYRILIVTDGAAGDASVLRNNINFIAVNTPIEVFTAGFCIDKGHTLYQPGLVEFRTAGNIVELKESMKAVLAESANFDQPLTFTK